MTTLRDDPTTAPPDGGHVFEEGEEPPPRGVRVMAVVRWLLLAFAVVLAVVSVVRFVAPQEAAQGQGAADDKFYCPMHPQIRSPLPGECPICNMRLEPIPEDAKGKPLPSSSTMTSPVASPRTTGPRTSTPPAAGAQALFTCPMHPEVHSTDPKAPCPVCNMALVPVESADGHDGHDHGAAAAPSTSASSGAATLAAPLPPPPGVMPLDLALDRVQAIGVRTAVAERKALGVSLRAPASVAATDEGRAEVHARASGFVEVIQVRETGVEVKRGTPLVGIYSPEIFQAQQELLASSTWGPMKGASPGVAALADQPARSRQRLELLGVSRFEIDRVVATGKPLRVTSVHAPMAGVVVRKNVVLGSFVTPEMTLYEIVDLRKVYVVADLFQGDVASIPIGTKGTFTTPRQPGRSFDAEVDLVYPEVDLAARTTRVRLRVENPERALLPGQFGSVTFVTAASDAVLVPRDAVVDTGKATYVFVVEPGGRYVPRSVEVGRVSDESVEIRRGIEPGVRVVSGATFLIDAESRLRASLQQAGAPR
jgi:Cu(I)/Ag(I) efflux system membrane fusion protein